MPRESQFLEAQLGSTNQFVCVEVRDRGVQVRCEQRLDDRGGPTVTITPIAEGWEVRLRPHNGSGCIRIRYADGQLPEDPVFSVAGVRVHYCDLFDDEADLWHLDE